MMSGKKIVYVITQSKYGGAQKYVTELAGALSAHNAVAVAVGELQDQDPTFFGFLAESPSISIHKISHLQRGINPWRNLLSIIELRRLYQQLEPDVIHINSSMAGFTASLAAYWYRQQDKKKTAVIYTAHGFVFDEPLPWLVKQLYIFIERIGARWKDAIITVSDQSKLSAIKHGIAPEKCITIHNGIIPSIASLSREQARHELKISENAVAIGTIASFYPTKGLIYLLQAVAKLNRPDFKFYIIGDGPQRDFLTQHIERLHIGDQIKLLGALAPAHTYLLAFDLFVLPSVKEGFPYAILEAGRSSLPVVATNVGGIPEIIQDGHGGWLVPPANSARLAETILQVLEQPAERKNRSDALHHTIVTDFTLQKMIDRTTNLYQRIFVTIGK